MEGLHISVGDLVVDNLRVLDADTAEGTITGSLPVGRYPVRVTLPDGRADMKTDTFRVFRAGVSKSVRLGTVTILADTIGQVEDKTFVASGNVSINGFIHSDGDLNIVADSLPDNFDINSGNSPYPEGENGKLEGNGKLYISYQQAQAVGESGGGPSEAGLQYLCRVGAEWQGLHRSKRSILHGCEWDGDGIYGYRV